MESIFKSAVSGCGGVTNGGGGCGGVTNGGGGWGGVTNGDGGCGGVTNVGFYLSPRSWKARSRGVTYAVYLG